CRCLPLLPTLRLRGPPRSRRRRRLPPHHGQGRRMKLEEIGYTVCTIVFGVCVAYLSVGLYAYESSYSHPGEYGHLPYFVLMFVITPCPSIGVAVSGLINLFSGRLRHRVIVAQTVSFPSRITAVPLAACGATRRRPLPPQADTTDEDSYHRPTD